MMIMAAEQPPILSILICTLTERKPQLDRLLFVLRPQAINQPVEILTREDNGTASIGEKRQRLLEEATGEYVCFVDDDDEVSPTYIASILAALNTTPDATHCSLNGLLIQVGQPPREFAHSTRYRKWAMENGVYVRPPNHVNPIRRDLALMAGFLPVSWGEDRAYSERLADLGCLTHEAVVGGCLYFYNYTPKPKKR